MMDLKALRYFVAVVEAGSITGAAERCFIAQPSISHAISKLEAELGLTLLVRHKRGVSTTADGEDFYREAKGLLNHAHSMRAQFINKDQRFTLTVSVAQTVAFAYLDELLCMLKKDEPSLQVRLKQSSNEADMSLTIDRLAPANELFIPLWRDRYCLILPSDHHLAFQEHISLSQLNGVAFVERAYCDRNSEWAEFLVQNQINIEVAASVDNEEWALSLVESGVGVSVVPLHQTKDYSNRFVVRELSVIEGVQAMGRSVGVSMSYNAQGDQKVKEISNRLAEYSQQQLGML